MWHRSSLYDRESYISKLNQMSSQADTTSIGGDWPIGEELRMVLEPLLPSPPANLYPLQPLETTKEAISALQSLGDLLERKNSAGHVFNPDIVMTTIESQWSCIWAWCRICLRASATDPSRPEWDALNFIEDAVASACRVLNMIVLEDNAREVASQHTALRGLQFISILKDTWDFYPLLAATLNFSRYRRRSKVIFPLLDIILCFLEPPSAPCATSLCSLRFLISRLDKDAIPSFLLRRVKEMTDKPGHRIPLDTLPVLISFMASTTYPDFPFYESHARGKGVVHLAKLLSRILCPFDVFRHRQIFIGADKFFESAIITGVTTISMLTQLIATHPHKCILLFRADILSTLFHCLEHLVDFRPTLRSWSVTARLRLEQAAVRIVNQMQAASVFRKVRAEARKAIEVLESEEKTKATACKVAKGIESEEKFSAVASKAVVEFTSDKFFFSSLKEFTKAWRSFRNEVMDQDKQQAMKKIYDKVFLETCSNEKCSGSSGSRRGVCGRCGLSPYCSRDCQKVHWKDGHRSECVRVFNIWKDAPVLSIADRCFLVARLKYDVQIIFAEDMTNARIGAFGKQILELDYRHYPPALSWRDRCHADRRDLMAIGIVMFYGKVIQLCYEDR